MPMIRVVAVSIALLASACSGSSTKADQAGIDEADAESGATTDSESLWPHDFQGSLLSGGQLDANDLAGSDLVLWFWAPW